MFVGYSLVSKAYKIYQPKYGKVITSRDVQFLEAEEWNWADNTQNEPEMVSLELEKLVDDTPVRGTRSLVDIYQRCNVAVLEPADFKAAENYQRWMSAMKEELAVIEKNQTWELVEKPKDRKIIGLKWVFRTKLNFDGSVNKHKASLVVKGYAQVWGVDFSETFAPVARLDTIRLVLALPAQKGWKVYHLDVKFSFLNGVLQEEIYVEQPEGFIIPGQEEKVYVLKKALYGLKQAPRAWNNKMDGHLLSLGFEKSLRGVYSIPTFNDFCRFRKYRCI